MSASPSLLVFAGSYAPADQPGIQLFNFDPATGALSPAGGVSGVTNPSFISLHPSGRWLYAVSETGEARDGSAGSVRAFDLQRAGASAPAPRPINEQPSGGEWPCHLQFDATGRWLMVANYGSGSVRVLPVGAEGGLGAATATRQHGRDGLGPNRQRQDGPHAHSTTVAPDNRFAIVADLGLDQLIIYRFDAAAGTLDEHGHGTARPGAGPRHATFHPNGRRLYVANELDNTVTVYDYDSQRGALAERQTLDTLPPGAPENTVADIHLAPDARRLYVSNRGHDSLAVYAVDAEGALERLAVLPCGGQVPRNFAVAPNGRFVLVANQNSGEIVALPVQAGGAELGAAVARAAMPGVACVQFLAGGAA